MIIEAKQGRYNKIHISIDGEYLTTVDSDFWYSCGYVSGDSLDEGELAAFKGAAGSRRAFNAAMDLISRREHSKKELFTKLCRRFDLEAVENAVERLCEFGLVDDERFAELYAKELYERKNMGDRRIIYELSSRGISSEIAKNAVEALHNDSDVDETEENIQRIVDIIEKKYYNITNDEKQRRRAWNALQRLGYSPGDIRRAFNEFSESDFDSSEGW